MRQNFKNDCVAKNSQNIYVFEQESNLTILPVQK